MAIKKHIVPCYNNKVFASDAIERALHETYDHVAVIVVNDGSTDNSAEKLGAW